MIPIRDTLAVRRMPVANWGLVALCTFGFGWEISEASRIDEVVHTFGLIPARFLALGERLGYLEREVWTPLITSTFLHGDLLHYASNMLFLWIFGANVEGRMGHAGYLLFFLAGGVAADLAHVAGHPASVVPTIGASGGIAAVMGAYFLLYPRARIVSIIPPVFWIQFRVPALLYLGFWFALQLYMASVVLEPGAARADVAWWAHAGGFAFGVLTVLVIGWRSEPAG